MFWALDERRKWRAKAREEGRVEGLAEGRAEGLEAGKAATARRYHDWLAKVAEEKNIPLADLLPPQGDQ